MAVAWREVRAQGHDRGHVRPHRCTFRKERTMKKILVAYDGGEPAHRALDMAADLATRYEAEVGVVSVVPFHGGRSPIDPWDDRSVHTEELVEARDLLLARGIEPLLYEPAGEPAAMIEHIAQAGDYDVVVVGSREATPARGRRPRRSRRPRAGGVPRCLPPAGGPRCRTRPGWLRPARGTHGHRPG